MIWHDFKRAAFGCSGADTCWACRLGKRLSRIEKRREKRSGRRRERRTAMRDISESNEIVLV